MLILYLCSSQRSIKRKRFDDEIVQYSQSPQLARIRSRRQSLVLTQPKEGGTTPVSETPETLPASVIPSQTLVNTNCEPKIVDSVKSVESLNQNIVPLPTSPITTVTANSIATVTAPPPTTAAVAVATATVVAATAIVATTSTTSTLTSIQQTISNISTPVLSPTSNSTAMIPQVPSIQPSTIVPAAVASPAPRKYHANNSI